MKILADPSASGTNPYVNILYAHVREQGAEVLPLSLRQVLRGGDVCHLHWPEAALNLGSAPARLNAALRLFTKLAIARFKGMAVVWTVHNTTPHEKRCSPAMQRLFYRVLDRLVDGKLFLSAASEKHYTELTRCPKPHAVVRHGDYKGHYAQIQPDRAILEHLNTEAIARGRVIGHYGLVRPYKNTVALVHAFKADVAKDALLVIAGKTPPAEQDLHEAILAAIDGDPRICYIPRYISDAEMLALASVTNLVALPYRNIHNSGAALLALSLGNRVLVPDAPTMRELQADAGATAVRIIDSAQPLGPQLAAALSIHEPPAPNLEKYSWPLIAKETLEFYQQMIAQRTQ